MVFKNAISWFEIPASDLNRAQRFYEAIFETQLVPLDLPNIQMRMFPLENPMGVGGAVCKAEGFYQPSTTDGVLLYLNGNPDVQLILNRVEKAGGKILVPKTEITPDYGHMAIIADSEGNRIGLHSIPQQK